MKKSMPLMLLIATMCFVLSSCSKDDDDFDYPLDMLYGKWVGTGIKVDDKWIDITTYPYTKFAFSMQFNSDGSYYGDGYFGNGGGTYKTKGNVIRTYIDGEEYAKYDIISLTSTTAEVRMSMDGSSETIELRVKKK